MVLENRPNHTLYVNNLNTKIKKGDLKAGLYYLFNQYGKVIDLVAMKTQKMRGQAFVGFRDISHAAVAMRALQSFPLFEKPMRIQFAKRDSQVVRRLKGQAPAAEKKEEKKRRKITIRMLTEAESAQQANGGAQPEPNRLLLLENLPKETTAEMLQMLFSQVDGFKEARCVDGRSDIAFVEYESEEQSKTALELYQGFKIDTEHEMRISFAKK